MSAKEIHDLINELKAWVNESNVNQADLARMLGVTRQRVNDWFIGKTKPTLEAWLKIQMFLRKHRRSGKRSNKWTTRSEKAGPRGVAILSIVETCRAWLASRSIGSPNSRQGPAIRANQLEPFSFGQRPDYLAQWSPPGAHLLSRYLSGDTFNAERGVLILNPLLAT